MERGGVEVSFRVSHDEGEGLEVGVAALGVAGWGGVMGMSWDPVPCATGSPKTVWDVPSVSASMGRRDGPFFLQLSKQVLLPLSLTAPQ